VSTYQAVSGAGLSASKELEQATAGWLAGTAEPRDIFPHPIAANLIPQIGSPRPNGFTSEEMKMVLETRKILGDESIAVSATCVRVPVANGHTEATRLLAAFPGIVVEDDLAAKRYPQPRTATGRDEVFVGRIREDLSCANGIALWCVSDNLRKGAATNAVQIAEYLATHGLRSAGTGAGRTVRT
jgi:aspartate-semialdehyde dehydrogenase